MATNPSQVEIRTNSSKPVTAQRPISYARTYVECLRGKQGFPGAALYAPLASLRGKRCPNCPRLETCDGYNCTRPI